MDFSPFFYPFFTTRPTSELYNEPLKVIPEGSMVQYLPVGSMEAAMEAPQPFLAKKINPQIPK